MRDTRLATTLFLACAVTLLAVSAAFPEEGGSSFDLGKVLISAEDWPYGIDEATTIGQEAINEPRASRTVDGLFEHTAGIDLQRTSAGGNTGREVVLRGFDESRYLVLLDGRPLNGAGVYGGNYVDWASLSTDDVERVEVIRGTESAEYGNTLGGTINVITKRSRDRMKIDVRTSYGSYNTVDAAVSHRDCIGGYVYDTFSYGYWRSDGYLRNNYTNRNNFSGRLDIVLPGDLMLGLGARYTVQHRGFVVENREGSTYFNAAKPESDEDIGAGPNIQWWGRPGPFGPVRPKMYWGDGSYWKDRRGEYDLSLEKSFGSLDLAARAYANREERKEYYYAIDNSNKLVLMRYSEPDDSWGLQLKAAQSVGKHSVRYGFEGRYLGYGGIEIPHADPAYFRNMPTPSDAAPDASRLNSGFIQGTWAISPAVDLDAGLRYDHYLSKQPSRLEKGGLSPKIGLVYRPLPGLEVTGHMGQAYRFPTCPESYWYFAGYQPPDRKPLSPERALQAEAGVAYDINKRGKIGGRYYYYYVYDYIRTIFGYRPSRVVYNIDTVMLTGFELEAEYRLVEGLAAFANYTYQTTTKEGDVLDQSSALSDSLTELPGNKINAGVRYVWRGLTTECVMRYVDKRQELTGSAVGADASSLSNVAPFATFDLRLSYKMLDRKEYSGSVGLALENLLDTPYEERSGFPMPGRTLTGSVQVQF